MITTTLSTIALALMMSCGEKDVKKIEPPVKPKVETVDPHAGHNHDGHNHDHSAHADEVTNGIVWVTDVNQALKLSKKLNKPVFTFFTGKQWCGWCKKLVAQVFVKDEFAKFANDNFIMLELDFPRRDRSKITPEMVELSRKFQVSGYPSVVIMDHKTNMIGRTGYKNMTPAQYVTHIKQVAQL
ncbi:MAG: thioredoxin family protein [Flavobacteriales bacterium]